MASILVSVVLPVAVARLVPSAVADQVVEVP